MRRSQSLLFVITFLLFLNLSHFAFAAGDCDFCPQNGRSSCESRTTLPAVVNDWHYKRSADLYFKCSCVEGYLGDGWRCNPIDECAVGIDGIQATNGQAEDYPCPPASVGGFCEDRDPQAATFPRYKCGCATGYQECLSGPNGAKGCKSSSSTICVDYSIAPPTPAPSPSPNNPDGPSYPYRLEDGCNLCPATAFCTAVAPNTADSYLSENDGGIWIKCTCEVGYSGPANGFRCEPINECTSGIDGNSPNNLPCPSIGGYCVDKRPDDGQYKCGCSEGYATENTDSHGATTCRQTLPTIAPTISPAPSAKPTTTPPPTTRKPTRQPTGAPTPGPTTNNNNGESSDDDFAGIFPTDSPAPSPSPSRFPTISDVPTAEGEDPTPAPTVASPSLPTVSNYPSASDSPSVTNFPSQWPSRSIIPSRTQGPSIQPSISFLPSITSFPSSQPSNKAP